MKKSKKRNANDNPPAKRAIRKKAGNRFSNEEVLLRELVKAIGEIRTSVEQLTTKLNSLPLTVAAPIGIKQKSETFAGRELLQFHIGEAVRPRPKLWLVPKPAEKAEPEPNEFLNVGAPLGAGGHFDLVTTEDEDGNEFLIQDPRKK